MSLRKIAFGTAMMASVSVLRLLGQFFALPILSRLLSPEEYGLVGIAMPFLFFAMTLADAGIGMSLVRTPSSERRAWSTCFWLSAMLGVALALVMGALSPLAAHGFGEPKLQPILLMLSVVVLLQALAGIPGAVLQQGQRYRTTALIEVTALSIGIATAVATAYQGAGAWALVWQQVAFFTVRLGLTWWQSAFRPLFSFDVREVREHLLFGRDVLGVNLLNFFSRSLDNLVIGKLLSAAAVGIYAMAFQFARLPMMLVAGPLQYVLYAQLAPIKDDTEAVGRIFVILTRALAVLIFPAMGMAAVAHEPVFTLLLSEKWAASGHMFMLVAAACSLQAVMSIGTAVRMVCGRTDLQLRSTLEFGLLWVTALLASAPFGLEWAAIAYNVSVLLYSPRAMMLVLPLIGRGMRVYAFALLLPAVVTGACALLYIELRDGLGLSGIAQLAAAAALALAGIGISALIQRRMILEELRFWRESQRRQAH